MAGGGRQKIFPTGKDTNTVVVLKVLKFKDNKRPYCCDACCDTNIPKFGSRTNKITSKYLLTYKVVWPEQTAYGFNNSCRIERNNWRLGRKVKGKCW